jgi:hypothetical protein
MSIETSKGCKALCSFAIQYRVVKRVVMLIYYAHDLMFALCSFRSK